MPCLDGKEDTASKTPNFLSIIILYILVYKIILNLFNNNINMIGTKIINYNFVEYSRQIAYIFVEYNRHYFSNKNFKRGITLMLKPSISIVFSS